MKKDFNDEMQKETMIRSLGVFELRGLARELGVSSPTTKKREELISMILEVIKGKNLVDVKTQRRGRPFKKLNSLDDIVSTMLIETKPVENYQGVLSFMQEKAPVFGGVGESVCELSGILRESEKGFCFFDIQTNQKVFINDNIDGFRKLKVGALVKVRAQEIEEEKAFWANDLLEINEQNIEECFDKDFDKGEEIISGEEISFLNAKAKVGRRNVFSFEEDLYENNNFEKLNEFCKENDYKLIVLGLNTSFENQIKFRELGVEYNFSTEYGTKNFVNVNKVLDVINFAEYCVDNGENIVVFILDILNILRVLDDFFNNSNDGEHAQQTLLVMQKLLALGRAYKNNCSGTLIIGYNEIDKEDKFLNNDILKISKKIN